MACTEREPDSQPTSVSAGEQATRDFELAGPGHVLKSLARSLGSVPRVQLPDTAPDDTGVADTERSSDAMPAPAERGGRYQLFGEIARGGMGAVLRGRDPDLGRDLAVKVLLESHEARPEMLRRFVEEAQIGGQLQHPGIVPVYELGTFADHRPYFTMKLVKGRTLSALLAERPSPAHDLPRFLSIFEAICQTVAYSHARGVIHRDLKPSNVMVGSFGEVQVMDWGLAKVLKDGGVADESPVEPRSEDRLVATVRSGSNLDESQAGSVLGTPAYMAPEQAAGDIVRVDRRSDVFGLGSILCEILTGEPAFTGQGAIEILRTAMRGETADALARLDDCGAEAELIALAKDCLAVETDDRPRDAGLVAGRVTAYLAGVQERVQAAERECAVAVARAIEERRRRKVQFALAASVLALTTLGGLSTTYYLQQRAARAAAAQRVIDQVATLLAQAVARPEEIQRWEVALAGVEQADPAGDPNTTRRLVALKEEIQAGLDAAQRDNALLDKLVDIRSAEADDQSGSATDVAYAGAFREAGIDLEKLPSAEAGAKIRARPPSVALALAAALDDWSAIRQGRLASAGGAVRLRDAACVADPEPWRIDLRNALDQADQAARLSALQKLEKSAKLEELGPISLLLLGTALRGAGDAALAESVLRRAQQRHPGDLWINYILAQVLAKLSRRDEAIRYFMAARAISPESAHELAHLLENRGESNEAIAVFRDLKRLRPANARNLACLAFSLATNGSSDEVQAALEAAIAASRAEIERTPNDALAHCNLGNLLASKGQVEDAVAEARVALRLKPDVAQAHALLGSALRNQGKVDEGIAELRKAIRLEPDHAGAHGDVGHALQVAGKLGDPSRARASLEEAVIESRAAIRLHPGDPQNHYHLGNSYLFLGNAAEAAAAFREAIRLKPEYAEALCNLGMVLQAQGDFAGAVAMLRKGHELGSNRAGWHYPSAQCLADAERRLAMAQGQALPAANPKSDFAPGDFDAFASIHKRAHELAPSKPGEAEPLFPQALEGYRKAQGPDGALTFDLTMDLATLLDQTGRGAEAEPLIVSGYEGLKAREARIPPPGKPRFTDASERVVKLYEAWGKPAKAAEWRARLSRPSDEANKPHP
jgi:serine/threonine-protein kinase